MSTKAVKKDVEFHRKQANLQRPYFGRTAARLRMRALTLCYQAYRKKETGIILQNELMELKRVLIYEPGLTDALVRRWFTEYAKLCTFSQTINEKEYKIRCYPITIRRNPDYAVRWTHYLPQMLVMHNGVLNAIPADEVMELYPLL